MEYLENRKESNKESHSEQTQKEIAIWNDIREVVNSYIILSFRVMAELG